MAKGDKKLETRKRIIDAASRSFRKMVLQVLVLMV